MITLELVVSSDSRTLVKCSIPSSSVTSRAEPSKRPTTLGGSVSDDVTATIRLPGGSIRIRRAVKIEPRSRSRGKSSSVPALMVS